ncbi:hypothetical protein [Paraburkholderia fungorum]|jgi:hypothetical protein|uniref:Uncharacterized protein n=1 Tax=Paraburkholderia fungorum TaxID=134537 RepID=A0AAP5Q7Y3_9BURK|nr:hypothetical protein [Paraburkholderia fungorum]MBU7438834.1 hypothetical protein [Paraburkholderia fungorum]MDT8838758.1 hypothetical protein [Paraburkholderia fungorum]PRZ48543.1 hypothetical protein BX589_1274 [Paraburkholderia fungorum]
MSAWEAVGVVAEGQQISISGLNPWFFDWTRSSEPPVELPHPQYQTQRHLMRVFEIASEARTVRFAAAEVSAGVWAFYKAGAQ